MGAGRRRAAGCLTVVFLPFAIGGLFGASVLIQHLFGWASTRGYVPAQCTIEFAELKVTGNDPGYEARARYRYSIEGRAYEGTRTHFGWAGDSGAFHPRLFEDLDLHRRASTPMPCFVDPVHPEKSVINRDLRFDIMALSVAFALVFGGAGFGGLRAALSLARGAR